MAVLMIENSLTVCLDPEKYVAKAIELAAFMDPEKDDYSALLPWNLSKEYDLS